jgi:hypothetical protein
MRVIAVFPIRREVQLIDHPEPQIVSPTQAIFTGVPGRKGPPIEVHTVNAASPAFESAIQHLGVFMERWPRALRLLITARFPMECALEPFTTSARGIRNVIAVGS